ncbi:MAG: sigma-70 family RNA polymerase sigma factor [Pseudomonadales bacterium]|nr:sigma-70 family RNA polymerase sigma factor [Pseudomonadales bacterium]
MRKLLHGLRSDESLMLAYQQGDALAFEVLYGRHKNALFAFLYRNCAQPAIVEELAQESWMSIIRRAAHYVPSAKFRTYLFQVAHHKLIDHWRRAALSAEYQAADQTCAQAGQQADAVGAVAAADIDAGKSIDASGPEAELEEHIMQEQIQTLLSRALSQIPNEQRTVFLLREAGFGQTQIAEIVGVGKQTVKSRLRYAVNQLRTLLQVSLSTELLSTAPLSNQSTSNEIVSNEPLAATFRQVDCTRPTGDKR